MKSDRQRKVEKYLPLTCNMAQKTDVRGEGDLLEASQENAVSVSQSFEAHHAPPFYDTQCSLDTSLPWLWLLTRNKAT